MFYVTKYIFIYYYFVVQFIGLIIWFSSVRTAVSFQFSLLVLFFFPLLLMSIILSPWKSDKRCAHYRPPKSYWKRLGAIRPLNKDSRFHDPWTFSFISSKGDLVYVYRSAYLSSSRLIFPTSYAISWYFHLKVLFNQRTSNSDSYQQVTTYLWLAVLSVILKKQSLYQHCLLCSIFLRYC